MKIGILGHYGDFNLGDEATIEAVIQNIRLASPEWTPCCFSAYPDDSRDRYQVEAYPIQRVSKRMIQQQRLRANNLDVQATNDDSPEEDDGSSGLRARLKRVYPLVLAVRVLRAAGHALVSSFKEAGFLAASFKHLKHVDLVLIAGSNQCFDYIAGPWYFPYNLLKWSAMTRMRGKKLAFVGVGAGPISAPLSKWMIRNSLALAHYRSFRDKSSKSVIDAIGAGHSDDHVLPDLAFSLQAEKYHEPRRSRAVPSKPVVGINPMPLFDVRFWPEGDSRKYGSLVQKYGDFTRWLLDNDYRVFFYATHPKDVLVVGDIGKVIGRPDLADIENCFPKTVDQLMARIAGADIAVATRFHGVLLPYVLGVPVLGIEYWPKTKDLMEYMGQSQYLISQSEFMEKIEGFDLAVMIERFESLVSSFEPERRMIQDRLSANRDALETQYNDLWATAGASRTQHSGIS